MAQVTIQHATVTPEVLFNIANSAIGIIGYFDCRPTGVDIVPNGFIVHWDHYGTPKQLKLDRNGKLVREEQPCTPHS